MGKSVVVTSGKGGVGKSTAVMGLGRALAARGRRVLLVDCDAGLRSLDRFSGIEEQLVYDIGDVVRGHCIPKDAIYSCAPGLFILPAPSSIENRVAPPAMDRLVPFLKKYYDYVILDSPAGIGTGFRGAVCAADEAIIVCNPDSVSVRGSIAVQKLLSEMGISKTRLLINRLNTGFFTSTGLYADLDSVIDDAGIQLFGVVREDYSMVSDFLSGKIPDPACPGAMAFSRIAGRLEGESIPLETLRY